MIRKYDKFNVRNAAETIARLRRILLEENLLLEEAFPSAFSIFLQYKYAGQVKCLVADDGENLVIFYDTSIKSGSILTPLKYSAEERLAQALLKVYARIDSQAAFHKQRFKCN